MKSTSSSNIEWYLSINTYWHSASAVEELDHEGLTASHAAGDGVMWSLAASFHQRSSALNAVLKLKRSWIVQTVHFSISLMIPFAITNKSEWISKFLPNQLLKWCYSKREQLEHIMMQCNAPLTAVTVMQHHSCQWINLSRKWKTLTAADPSQLPVIAGSLY